MSKTKHIVQPIAPIKPKTLVCHENSRTDNYYWMNDRENPEVIQYLEKENEYKNNLLKETEGLQASLFKEMKGRIKEDDSSVPYFKNGYFYYNRYEKGKEYPVYCRKEGHLESEELTLLNVNDLAEGHEYTNVNALAISENNKLLAYSLDTVGRRIYNIHFKALDDELIVKDQLKSVTGNIAWAADNKTVFIPNKMLKPFARIRYTVMYWEQPRKQMNWFLKKRMRLLLLA